MTAGAEPVLVGVIRWAGNARRLVDQHARGADGRCVVCSAGGTGTGHVVWPCNLYLSAMAALVPPQRA